MSQVRSVAVVDGPDSLAAELADAGHTVSRVVAPELDVLVSTSWLSESYRLYRALREHDDDVVLFAARPADAYCACRAKQAGVAFEDTTIVVRLEEPRLRPALRGPAFLPKRAAGEIITERLVLELADALVCRDADRAWLEEQGWRLPGIVSARWEDALAAPVAARPPVAADAQLVSVVVPVHERVAYLPFCIEALAAQMHAPLEVIVVDDGSRSPEVGTYLRELEQRSWPWPFRVLHIPHSGLGGARNAGWRAATGELVVFVDDDDVPFSDLVATLVTARAASGADVVVAGARTFAGEGRPEPGPRDKITISFCNPRELTVLGNHSGGPVCLWARTWLERLGGFGGTYLEDWDLLLRAEHEGAVITTPPDPLFWYRRTPGSMFTSRTEEHVDPGLQRIAARLGAMLPDGMRLLPLLAAGAYEELDRRAARDAPGERVPLPRRALGRLRRRYDRRR